MAQQVRLFCLLALRKELNKKHIATLPLSQLFLENIKRNSEEIIFRTDFSTSANFLSEKKLEVKPGFKIKKVVTEHGIVEVKKKVFVPRVTLIGPDDSLQILTIGEAEKIAKRRGLKLLKTLDLDTKTERPVYKLLTAAEYFEATKKEKTSKSNDDKKAEKLLTVKCNISEHDLQAKVRHILRWLQKEHTVRVVISGDNGNLIPAERVYDIVSESVKDVGRIVQKITKNGEIKFQILLPKKKKVVNEETHQSKENVSIAT